MATDDSQALRTRLQQGVENGERFITIEVKGYKQGQQVTLIATIAADEGWRVNAVWHGRRDGHAIAVGPVYFTNVLFEHKAP